MKDYFISYTSADSRWAEWIAYVLEDAGSSTVLQAWDFRPGSNFVLEMQKAASSSKRTILVLSPDYLKSKYTAPEWSAAFAGDPSGNEKRLVPIMVRQCELDGMLRPLVHIDLTDLAEDEARKRLLEGVRSARSKPAVQPGFPGKATPPKTFPGSKNLAARSRAPYLPKIKRAPSDLEKRRFLREVFDEIKEHFEAGFSELKLQAQDLEIDFHLVSKDDFRAEIFLHGKSISACRVWLGGGFSDNAISYSEGRHSSGSNSCNEMLTINEQEAGLFVAAMFGGFVHHRNAKDLDLKRLSPVDAAEYLWRRFVSNLET